MLKTCIITKAVTATDIMEDLLSFPHHCFVTCKTIPHSFHVIMLQLRKFKRSFSFTLITKSVHVADREDIKGNVEGIKEMLLVGKV